MKKREIINIIITAGILAVTNKFWLIFISKTHAHFEFYIFMIILACGYLISGRITNYLAELKTHENKSRTEIIFLAIFFILLFIPMSHIKQGEISRAENRKLAKRMPLITKKGEINYNFGKQYDKWFNDRFNLRQEMVNLYGNIHYMMNSKAYMKKNGGVYINKKTGQMFGSYPDAYKPLTKKQLDLYSANLNKLNMFCQKRNIKLVILNIPCVNSFFRDEDIMHKPLKQDRIIPLVKIAKEKYNLDIIYPENELRKYENGEYVYFKTDHHLTDYGTYIVYKLIINTLKKEYPKLTVTPEKDFNIYKRNMTRFEYTRKFEPGCEYNSLGISNKKLLKTEYKFYDYKYKNITVKELEHKGDYKHTNPKGNYRLMIIGDSTHENLTYFLNTNFKEIYKFRTNAAKNPERKSELDMKYWGKVIDEIKPDILIINKHTGTLDGFLTKVF